jgi:hypothetical protein
MKLGKKIVGVFLKEATKRVFIKLASCLIKKYFKHFMKIGKGRTSQTS